MPRRVGPEEYDDGGGPLFGHPPHNGTPTSIAAAESKRAKADTERARVFEYIRNNFAQGVTREQIEDGLGMPGNTVRPRVWELLGNGGHPKLIFEGPNTRKTRSGRNAVILWAIRR